MFNQMKASCRALLASAVLFAGTGAALAETTLKVVPSADLQVLDPMGSTADIVKMHGFMIYDTLYALDADFKPQPQMVKDMTLSDDKKTYRFTLRDGLKWHDGEPVKAEDCVASLKRWQQRDAAGQLMARQLKDMRVVDEKTFELEFNEPYGIVLESLSKVASNIPFMMPKRVAETDAFKEITDYTGSGPYKFAKDKWVPGSKVVYEKFADYVPRSEPASAFAGGKVAEFDTVEWDIIKDQQTALSALMSGEVDFWQSPSLDLLPVIEAAGTLKTKVVNETGTQGTLFFNHTQPPFDNGSHRPAKMPNVCAGPRTARAHVTWCGAPILRGELVNIEPAASVFDYHTPIFRFYSIGRPAERVLELFDVCKEALSEGFSRVRPGMTSHEAARTFESVIEKRGFAEWMVTRPAYSIGGSFAPGWGEDEVMAIRRNHDAVLEEGMCFHVTPCLYQDGVGCVGASMPAVLTADGFESLSGDDAVFGIK